MNENAPHPIVVLYVEGVWEVRNSLGETLVRRDTKADCIDEAKDWARNNRYDKPVIIHDTRGDIQRVWWTENQRYLRVRPMNRQEKKKYRSIREEFKNEGHNEPFWSVERKKNGNWNLQDIKPTKGEAVEAAKDLQDQWTIREVTVYGTDWTKTGQHLHSIEKQDQRR
jgi:hypothetical protein